MLSKPEARQAILNLVVTHYPKDTWPAVQLAATGSYHDAWASTRDDPRFALTPGQRRFRALQERHFLMEGGMANVAVQNAIPFAGEIVQSNDWVYGMIRTPGLCLMQKRVQTGKEPPPADFRRQIAGANSFVRQGDLFVLGDAHTVGDKPIHGILIHMAESKDFRSEAFGRPAFVKLAVPYSDYTGWIATFSLLELIAAYPVTGSDTASERPAPTPTWKKPDEEEGKGEGTGRG